MLNIFQMPCRSVQPGQARVQTASIFTTSCLFQQPVGKCFSECKVLQNRSILACQVHEPKAEVSLDV